MRIFTDLYIEFYNYITNRKIHMDVKAYYQKIPKVYIKAGMIALAVFIVLVGVLAGLFFQKRDVLLAEAIAKVQAKAKKEYQIDLQIDHAGFSGLKSVLLTGLRVIPEHNEPLAIVKRLEVSVKFFPLLTGTIKIGEVNLADATVTFIKKDSTSNYDFLFKAKPETIDTTKREPLDLASLANRMVNSVLYKIPDNMILRNLNISYQDDSVFQTIAIPKADIDGGTLSSTILVNKNESTWHVEGQLKPNQKKLFLRLFAEGKKVEFPLIEKKYGLKLTFDTLETNLETVKWKNKGELLMSGTWRVSNLLMNHWRIASNDITIPDVFLDTELVIGKDFIALDKSSEIRIAKIIAHPYAKVTLGGTKTYALGVRTADVPAQEVFDSFPRGLFASLEGIQVSGEMNYQFDFFLDEKQPDSVQMESALSAEGFKVNVWGKTDLTKINSTFVYVPYEDGKPQRSIIVGPNNPDFVPINQVSSFLKNAILTAEDPSFFSHQGFVPEAIRASIATNFKEKAFKRGGSTISMQLVKNVFLDREKTLARKVEEMLIVWLIESNHLVSKERMYEVYLNIIEWGRNVYGVNEAARYYFMKRPADLDLGESIFLASIVPRPKNGLSRFDHTGHLKPYMSGYFRLIGNLMAQRGFAPVDSTRSYGFYSVNLREGLRPAAPKVDSTEMEDPDSLNDEIEDVKSMLENLFKQKSDNEQEK